MTTYGKVTGVGIGPGDPELLTIKAFRAIKEADVVAYPKKKRGANSYAYEIISPYKEVIKEELPLVFPMTKEKDVLEREWKRIADELFLHVKEGKNVAFVTEGDPMLYSTFIHLLKTMRRFYPKVPLASIPGVSSTTAVASTFLIPFADGDEEVAVIPATENREKMKEAIETHDSIVFIKVAKVLPMMVEILEELNLLSSAVVATKVTSEQEILWRDVEELRYAELEYLTLMMVRKERNEVFV